LGSHFAQSLCKDVGRSSNSDNPCSNDKRNSLDVTREQPPVLQGVVHPPSKRTRTSVTATLYDCEIELNHDDHDNISIQSPNLLTNDVSDSSG